MTGNRALLTNFVEKFLGTVRFGNDDFAVIAGYGDVVIGPMTIKKVYYLKGLGHNLFSVGQFCDKGLEVAFRKSSCFVRSDDGVDLLTGDRSSNLYTIALNDITSNSSVCLLAKASSAQYWLWHQRLSHLNLATINNFVKNSLVRSLSKMKFKKDHLCFACEQGKIHRKHHKSKTAFASNKPLYLLHMDLWGPMRVELINGKRYVLAVVNDYSRYTWVLFLRSKDEVAEVIISFIKKTQVNLQLQVKRGRTDNGTEFKNKTLAKFFDEDLVNKGRALITDEDICSSCIEIEAIRLFLAYAAHIGFHGLSNGYHVYALDKALYGLKQAHRHDIRQPNETSCVAFKSRPMRKCHLDQKSTSGSVQFLGDKLVCWLSKKQNCVSISTTKSEYVAISGCCAQVLWMRTQLTDYGFFYDKVPIYCESKSAIVISCNPV
ncbi:retrovirus-related pol polyprotein from transposon TNT 1-94 [Tanacetum coccineum]